VSLPEDVELWFEVQVQTLQRVHPSWLPAIPPELQLQARQRPLGRRWLANRLSIVSPALFGLPAELGLEAVAELRAAAWLAPVVSQPIERALDLGALALAATVRTLVNRAEVVKLRAALGAQRYSRVLTAAVDPAQPAVAFDSNSDDIAGQFIRCGATELAAYADCLHPAWGESVRLTYERSWWLDAASPNLTPAAAAACLRRVS
jgi:hypothetical protein